MKYTLELVIDAPLKEVIKLFDNPDNMKEWQPGLLSFETISGQPGQEGAKAKLKYKIGKREIEMIETITKIDLPHEFFGTYETKGVWNEIKNYFREGVGDTTHWTTENEFRVEGFFMKLMCFLMPGAFKKETMKHMQNFKNFVEGRKK